MGIPFLIALLCLTTPAMVHAGPIATDEFVRELEGRGAELKPDGQWEVWTELFGLPYVLITREKGDAFRSNISVAPLGRTPRPIPGRALENTPDAYRAGRTRYMEEMRGRVLEFLPPRHQQRDARTRVHAFGYEYRLGDATFHEQSHYVFCGSGEVWTLQSTALREPAAIQSLDEALRAFRCRE